MDTNLTETTEKKKYRLKATVTEEIEKEVELPYYCKYGESHFIKLESEVKAVIVHTYGFSYLIEVSNIPNESIISQSEDVSEEEFNEALLTTFVKLQNNAL
jgi:hypothetical protein